MWSNKNHFCLDFYESKADKMFYEAGEIFYILKTDSQANYPGALTIWHKHHVGFIKKLILYIDTFELLYNPVIVLCNKVRSWYIMVYFS